MVGVMLVMISSFRDTVEIWIDQTVMADFIVGCLPGGRNVVQRGASTVRCLPGAGGAVTGLAVPRLGGRRSTVTCGSSRRTAGLAGVERIWRFTRPGAGISRGRDPRILIVPRPGKARFFQKSLANHRQSPWAKRVYCQTPEGSSRC